MTVRLMIYFGYYALSLLVMADSLAFVLTLPMFALVIFNISRISDPYFTTDDMIHFIMYLFFVVGPLQSIDHGHIGVTGPVSAITYTSYHLSIAMLIAFILYATWTFVILALPVRQPNVRSFVIGQQWTVAILAIAVTFFVLYVSISGGIAAVLAPRYDRLFAQADEYSSSSGAIAIVSLGILSMTTLLLASQLSRQIDQVTWCFAAALALLVICLNPLNAARFFLLEAYVPLALVLLQGKVRATVFYGAAMLGILVLFPVLNLTTRFGLSAFTEHGDLFFSDALHLQFVDTYDLLVECVRYVEAQGYDYGTKLLADLVIYFPREWWPGKPVLGGLDVGYRLVDQGFFGTANVSQIVVADGYMDFGLFGVLLVSGIVSFVLHMLIRRRRFFVNGHDLFGYAFIAALPILVRGPLGAVISIFLFQALTLMFARSFMGRRRQVAPGTRLAGIGMIVPDDDLGISWATRRQQGRGALAVASAHPAP